MEKIKGMTACKVCGRDFPLIAEEHYVAADPRTSGVISALVSTDKAYLYDVFDCPHCGCQNILQSRKPYACPCDYGICDECQCEDDEEEEEEEDDAPETPCKGCCKE